jgi:hypothetical protein
MPSREDYTTRREAYAAWLTANGIEPGHVLSDADVYIETRPDGTRHIVYEGCHLDAEGRRHLNERGDGVAIEHRTTPLLVEPPDWWQPYRKPTRDQLLTAVERVRALHNRWESDLGCCAHCQDGMGTPLPWPCPTIRALDGTENL